jgi:putative transcriptional regulator
MTLKELRKQRGFTQHQLADALGLKQRTVSSYERGERHPSPKTAQKIAALLGMTISEMWQTLYAPSRNDESA